MRQEIASECHVIKSVSTAHPWAGAMNCLDCRAKCCGIYNVEIQESELRVLSRLLQMSEDEFKRKCLHILQCANPACKKVHYYINTKPIGKEVYCMFIEEGTFKCMIYDMRPSVCSSYRCARYLERVAQETGDGLSSVTSMISKLDL